MGIKTEFTKALYARLNGAALGVQGVYTVVPEASDGGDSSVFPYVKIGVSLFNQADTQTKLGDSVTFRIHTHSRAKSIAEALAIQDAIYIALHRQVLSITGYSNFVMLRNDTDLTDEIDGKIHGVCEYRALIESA